MLVHVKHGIENSDVRISLLKFLFKLNQNLRRQLSLVRITRSIVLVADLNYQFIKRLLLLAVKNMVVVIFNNSVLAFLLGIVFRKSRTKQFTIYLSDIFFVKNDIIFRTSAVNVVGIEITVIVGNAPFAYGYA